MCVGGGGGMYWIEVLLLGWGLGCCEGGLKGSREWGHPPWFCNRNAPEKQHNNNLGTAVHQDAMSCSGGGGGGGRQCITWGAFDNENLLYIRCQGRPLEGSPRGCQPPALTCQFVKHRLRVTVHMSSLSRRQNSDGV